MLLLLFAIVAILIDNTPPVINLNISNNTIINTSIIKTNITDNFGIKECYYVLNNQKVKFNCKSIKLNSGCYNLTIIAKDIANNENQLSINFCIDLQPPKILSYGFYPSNNTQYQNSTYKFWIKVYDDLKLSKVAIRFNDKLYQLKPSNYVVFNTTKINIGKNEISWVICDISNKCTTLNLIYYVKPLTKHVLKFNLKKEIFLGECQTIEYETNVKTVNLTIIYKNKNFTVSLPGKGNYTFCPKEVGLYKVNLLGVEKYFNVIYATNSSISVIKLNKLLRSKVEVRYKNKLLYRKTDLVHKILLPNKSELHLDTLNNSLKIHFYEIIPKRKIIIEVLDKINKNGIIYYIRPNFKFKKAILYLDKKNLTYIDVYICKIFNIKRGCLSKWNKIDFIIEGNYIKVKYDVPAAFMIKQKSCMVKIISPNVILTIKNKTKCFYVNIETRYCPSYSLKIVGNYTELDKITDNLYEVCILYTKMGTYHMKIKYGNFEKSILIKVISEVNEPYLVAIPPKLVVKTYEKDKEIEKSLLIKNIGNKGTYVTIYSDTFNLNQTIYIKPKSYYKLNFKVRFGDYLAKIYINYSKGTIIVPVKVIYIPNWVNISLKLLNKNPPYIIKIEVYSNRSLDNVNLCYGIKGEFVKCEDVNLTTYQYFIRILKPKKAGNKIIFAKLGDKEVKLKVAYRTQPINISIKDLSILILLAAGAIILTKLFIR